MKKKGFTLVELLVVIAIIALLMGILMPALAKVRQMAQRMVCGTNLSSIGKAITIYINDNEDEYPRSGGAGSYWSPEGAIQMFDATTERFAFGLKPVPVTVTSCLYLLVKYADAKPAQFYCKGDVGAKDFELTDEPTIAPEITELQQLWDFGGRTQGAGTSRPGDFCSYSYHIPLDSELNAGDAKPLSGYSEPGMAICADRTPYMDRNVDDSERPLNLELATWESTPEPGAYSSPQFIENSELHKREGQNVLFNDGRVIFAKHPVVGIDNDNIWWPWPDGVSNPTLEQKQVPQGGYYGEIEEGDNIIPYSLKDSVLVGEDNRAEGQD